MMPIRSCRSIASKALTMPTSTASATISRTRGPTEKSPRCLGISGTAALKESRMSANEESPDHYWRAKLPQGDIEFRFRDRSEGRRVGKECGSTGRYRRWQEHEKKKQQENQP